MANTRAWVWLASVVTLSCCAFAFCVETPQPPIAQPTPHTAQSSDQTTESASQFGPWIDALSGPGAAAGSAIAAWLLTWLAGAAKRRKLELEAEEKLDEERKAAAKQLEEERKALRLPKPPAPETRRCSALLLGIGGTGKSSLVKSMGGGVPENRVIEGDAEELPSSPNLASRGQTDEKTRCVRTWDERLPWGGKAISLSITDYVGQNIGTLVRYFAREQKTHIHQLRTGTSMP